MQYRMDVLEHSLAFSHRPRTPFSSRIPGSQYSPPKISSRFTLFFYCFQIHRSRPAAPFVLKPLTYFVIRLVTPAGWRGGSEPRRRPFSRPLFFLRHISLPLLCTFAVHVFVIVPSAFSGISLVSIQLSQLQGTSITSLPRFPYFHTTNFPHDSLCSWPGVKPYPSSSHVSTAGVAGPKAHHTVHFHAIRDDHRSCQARFGRPLTGLRYSPGSSTDCSLGFLGTYGRPSRRI